VYCIRNSALTCRPPHSSSHARHQGLHL